MAELRTGHMTLLHALTEAERMGDVSVVIRDDEATLLLCLIRHVRGYVRFVGQIPKMGFEHELKAAELRKALEDLGVPMEGDL
jgi:hypothetical protein